jgi:hypothetical protein
METVYVVVGVKDDIVMGEVASAGERALNVASPSTEYS